MVLSKRFKKRAAAMAMTLVLTTSLVAASAGDAFAALSGNLVIGGSSTVAPLGTQMANDFMAANKKVKIKVYLNDSGTGRNNTCAGAYNIGMSSSSWANPYTYNSQTYDLQPTQVARDALTFVVNSSNKVKSLTKSQLQGIYTGTITNWSQVGGANKKITVCGRAVGSGTGDYVNKDIFGSATLIGTLKTYPTNGALRTAVHNDKNAIGYLGMAYAKTLVRGLKVNGVAATAANARAGKYPFVRPLFWCTIGAPTGLAKSFIDWSRSKKGQADANKLYMSIN